MNLSEPFVRRPVATTLLTAAIALSGAVAYRLLPVSPLPEMDFPTISVNASLPGASPETMASSVATPLERQFGRISGVNQMTSTSQLGSTNIVLQFDLSRNIDAAARDVQAAINAARGQLPANLPNNPGYRKVNPADAPILILALSSDEITLPRIYDVADSILSQKLAQVGGVGQVFVGGGVRLGDVAEVEEWVEETPNVGLANGEPAVLIIVFRQPGANIISTVDHVYGVLPLLKSSIPPSINLHVVMDRTTTIRASVTDIEFTLMISIVLVILVVFLFLRTVRATVIPSVAVPLSLIGTFAVMYLLHYSLDNLSLMALASSTGFVVDDAIVVLENITRYLEHGMGPVQAAFK